MTRAGATIRLVRCYLFGGDLNAARCARGHGGEHVLLALHQGRGVVAGGLEAVPVRDGVGGAGLDAIPAENTAVVIDVVDLRVTLAAGNAELIRVLGRFNIDAVGRAGRGAKEAGDALFQAVNVTLQDVNAAEPLLELGRLVGVV